MYLFHSQFSQSEMSDKEHEEGLAIMTHAADWLTGCLYKRIRARSSRFRVKLGTLYAFFAK